ncbi:C39 family peptidase [Paraferrimonas sp. SM1919]|uniref:C39 family peptidase n=1 Tax=Paraferrimonas sp. SM1919 TaxID=2662263 RepID=UPI0013D59CCD|nr:C39 family peptidase [Paraferrimonas sp. SM1919]
MLNKVIMALMVTISSISFAAEKVPFYNQMDNKHEGWRACNITSLAMVLDYFGVQPKNQIELRMPDHIYQRFGIKQDPFELQAVFNMIARDAGSPMRDVFYERGTVKQLQALAQKGIPTIVHGWFTKDGHIVVVTGYDGDYYTVNDPYGKWLGKKWLDSKVNYDTSVSGFGVRYKASEFEHAINDNGTGDDLWLHTFVNIDQLD